MIDISKKVKEARKRKGLSQEELADLIKVNLRTIQRIENNESKPRGKTLSLICNALDLNAAQMIDSKNQIDKKQLVIPILLTLIIFISSFLEWFTFESTFNKGINYYSKINSSTGWNGEISYKSIVIYNWLVSLCSLSIGGIVILSTLNILKKHLKFVITQLIIILFYIILYISLSISHETVSLKYGLFLVIVSVFGLTIIFHKMKPKKDSN